MLTRHKLMSEVRTTNWGRFLHVLLNMVVCAAIVGGTYAGIRWIYKTQPTAQKDDFRRKSAALVETMLVSRKTWSPNLTALGTVQPAQDIVISPRVRGQVLELSPKFSPGQMVGKGELLLQIDPADFENSLAIRRSELEQVQADWKIEEGRQSLAKQELQLLGDSIDEINRALVLREPQAASIQSRLNAATAALERAQLDLDRTRLVAPFDAQVLRQDVNVGSQVQPGDDLGQLVGVNQYWVMAALPMRHLRWIQYANDEHSGSKVTLHDPDTWGPDHHRVGEVSKLMGSLDEQTRLARILITVEDPHGLNSDAPPLILDTLIEVRIQGTPIADVVRLPREFVRNRDTVWVMVDGELKIRETEIVFQDPEYAYISSGLEDGDEVVVTTLATVADGVKLRRVESEGPGPESSESDALPPEKKQQQKEDAQSSKIPASSEEATP